MSAGRNGQNGIPVLDDAARVRRIAGIADAVGATRLRDRALAFAERIDTERLYVACVGQVKRGKSSLLNALIGEQLLPTGIVPVTAVPTIVRHGTERRVRVHFATGVVSDAAVAEIAEFVGEAGNPENTRGVEAVEVFVPSPLLAPGLCLIDTPGLGSIIQGAGSLTRSLVPHIDAAIVVIGVDPPLSGDELALIGDVARVVQDLIVVLNKADRFDATDRRAARTFAAEAIARHIGRPIGGILEVSAKEALAGEGERPDWGRLVAELTRLTSDERPALVRSALRRGVQRLVDECLAELAAIGRATYSPVAQLEDRLDRLRSITASTAFESLSLRQLIEREVARARESTHERRTAFLKEREADAGYEVARAIRYATVGPVEALHAYGMALAAQVARRELEGWARGEADLAGPLEHHLTEQLASAAHAALAAALLLNQESGLAPALTDDLDVPALAAAVLGPLADAFGALTAPDAAAVTPARTLRRRLADRVRSEDRVRQLIGEEVRDHLAGLLERGSARIANALAGRLEDIGTRIEARLRGTLDDAYERADRMIAVAQAMRERDAKTARRELNRLAELRREVSALRPPEADTFPSRVREK